ncbi:MAG: cation:proton antiporter [Pseudomonadota bacterium]|nr:cation:proton antiporter [Pseudomonadota bacterium]
MKESLLLNVLLEAGLFLALAALIIPLLKRFKVPSVLGYLIAGVVFGPYGVGALAEYSPFFSHFALTETAHVKMLAELGIIMLLFVIGLELTPQRLWQMRNLVFGLGSAQVLTSAFVIGGIAFLWGNSAQLSILLGLGLSLSSTAIIIQWIHEKKMFAAPAGRASFSILLLQDLAVIPILFLLTIFAAEPGENMFLFTTKSLAIMALTATAMYVIGQRILRPVFAFANQYGGHEVFMALSLLTVVVSASVAGFAGMSMALGAFIAGLLLADTEYRHEITAMVVPFKGMLLGIFFLSFGMSINLDFIAEKPVWLGLSVVGLMMIKAAIIYPLCRMWKQSKAVAAESAIMLSQAGEFGLLVIGSALALGLVAENVGQFMLITVGLTMFVTPLITVLSRKVGAWVEVREVEEENIFVPEEVKKGHIVIFGFGRMGQTVAEILCREGMKVVGFDNDAAKIHKLKSTSYPVYFADSSKKTTVMAAELEHALCAVITLDEPVATKKLAKNIRKLHPNLPIYARAEDESEEAILEKIPYVDAVPEHLAVSQGLAEKVLEEAGYDADEAHSMAMLSQTKQNVK